MSLSRAARGNSLEMLKTVRVIDQPQPVESQMFVELWSRGCSRSLVLDVKAGSACASRARTAKHS